MVYSNSSQQPLSRNPLERSSVGFDDLQTQFRGSFPEQLHLLFAVALLVVLQTLIDVLVPPLQHAIDEASELVSHRGDGFRRAEFAAETAVLGTEVTLAP